MPTFEPAPRYDRTRTAVLVLDVQRDFLADDGRMPVARAHVPEILAAINAVVDAAATHGVPVAYVRNSFPKEHWIRNAFRNGAAVRGTPGAELDPRLRVVGADVFEKSESDAFSDPKLEAWMRRKEIGTLIVTGLFAEACVCQTVRGAIHRGYAVHLVKDGVASKSDGARASAIAGLAKRGAHVLASLEVAPLLAAAGSLPR
jgi:nicotinamidase-related amidase